ncbi:1-aminocyclopropane-1-carboxylate synthase-like protein 1 [Ptychodera flava]|uniref:1-aminocyclopropane-1-carboxylate synthase-like protein 1 n=1 Tax=Ptychodera flava TaxID=63121 RepID=UPI00396A9154
MFTVFDEKTQFTSVLSLDDLPDPDRTHFIWGFSKDFCMSSLRCGAIYTWNKQVVSALGGVAYWFSVPTAIQFTVDRLLADEEWVADTYLPTNRKRLRDAYEVMSKGLTQLGIPHRVRSAGLYIWADFRMFVSPLTFEAELEMFYELIVAGVYIPAGQCFYCQEPGWFRIIFALSENTQRLVLHRIGMVIEKRRKPNLQLYPCYDDDNNK